METYAVHPGSCGELIQGNIQGMDMLLSFPVDLFTTVRLYECKNPKNRHRFSKSSALLSNLLERWGYGWLDGQLDLEIRSDIPQGKGFASSTADLCGVYISLLKLLGREYDTREAAEEFIRIEPTDSIIFREMTLFDYKEGKRSSSIGQYRKFSILAFEGSRIVDTQEFNRRKLPSLGCLDDVMPQVMLAAQSGNIRELAGTASMSIERNMGRVNYEVYGAVEELRRKTGGLGIVGGHSGDLLGIMYDDRDRFLYAARYKDTIPGYKAHMIETLRRDEYERDCDYGTSKRQREDNDNRRDPEGLGELGA